ncbi:MAG TPA: response regulator, partial [candidate division Zixibacteria bacterium]|nr:response regulator [candidate division Zixibacteria bacterium]
VRMKSFLAENDESAMKKLEEFTPSLLIVDLVNPDSQGLELLGRLAASTNGWAKIPLVILSNTPDNCEAYENLSSHASVVSKENLESSELIISAMKAVTKTNRLLLAEDKAVLNTEIPHNEGETILVVEDTPDNMELFGWILDGESLNYEGVEDGQSALNAVRQKKYDLILMDINLPDINGKDVTRSIRKISAYENTPIIAVTAHAIKTEIEGIMDSGITELVTKPINQTELISVINKHLPH